MENIFKWGMAVIAAVVSFLWGEWSTLLNVLIALAFIDYASGMAASWIEGKKYPNDTKKGWSSKIGMIGIAKKFFIFLVIGVANLIDQTLIETGMREEPILFTAAIVFYIANELLSITENVGRIGVPLPPQIKQVIQVLKGEGK